MVWRRLDINRTRGLASLESRTPQWPMLEPEEEDESQTSHPWALPVPPFLALMWLVQGLAPGRAVS